MVFSADHMNDPSRIRSMCKEGFMSEGRRDALLDFPWHHDIIFHEAGIPPIHTPMQTLQVRDMVGFGRTHVLFLRTQSATHPSTPNEERVESNWLELGKLLRSRRPDQIWMGKFIERVRRG